MVAAGAASWVSEALEELSSSPHDSASLLRAAARGEVTALLDALLLKPPAREEWALELSAATVKRALGVLLCSGELLRLKEGDRERTLGEGAPSPLKDDRMTAALLGRLATGAPRRVCQYAFRKNDIVWICRSCQADETCVLCNACYRGSNHAGHEVFFYHAQAGGCCDCGDPDAWASSGFCTEHGGRDQDPQSTLPPSLINPAQKVLGHVVESLRSLASFVKESFDVSPFSLSGSDSKTIFLHVDEVHPDDELAQELSATCNLDSVTVHSILATLKLKGEVALPTPRRGDVLSTACALKDKGLLVSIRSEQLEAREARAHLAVDWLLEVGSVSDGTCQLVCERLDDGALLDLMIADSFLGPELRDSLHQLYLALMADQAFKTRIATAYTRSLVPVMQNYAAGIGISDSCIFTLSVQFLNRSIFVNTLVEEHGFLTALSECLLTTLSPASRFESTTGLCTLSPGHPCLRYRRYMPAIADLKCVLNIEGIPQKFLAECFWQWIRVLGFVHGAGAQRRYLRSHVEYESKDWMHIFNINISLCSVFVHVTSWLRMPTPADDNGTEGRSENSSATPTPPTAPPASPPKDLSTRDISIMLCELPEEGRQRMGGIGSPCTAEQFFRGVLKTLKAWDQLGKRALSSALLAGRCLESEDDRVLYLRPRPSLRSFHPTLHRFLAASVKEACKCSARVRDVQTLADDLRRAAGEHSLSMAAAAAAASPMKTTAANCRRYMNFCETLVDEPLLSLTLAAEVNAGLWIRNGVTMNDQVQNYAEPPFCRMFRDLDLLAVQVAALGCDSRKLTCHFVKRYMCFEWLYAEPSEPKTPPVPPVRRATIGEQEDLEALLHPSSPRGIFAQREMHEPPPGTTRPSRGEGAAGDMLDSDQEAPQANPPPGIPPPPRVRRRSSAGENPEGLDDIKQQAMVGELLLFFILFLTEMPRAPDEISQIKTSEGGGKLHTVNLRVMADVRRELVHRLAVGPCTHSELQDACSLVDQADSMPSSVLETLLSDLSQPVPATSPLEPERYVIKKGVEAEYDPAFWHISLQMHQAIMDRKMSSVSSPGQSVSPSAGAGMMEAGEPICPRPPYVHQVFHQMRLDVATESTVVDVIARVLERDSKLDTMLTRVLHLLTLILYIVDAEANSDAADVQEAAALARPDAVLRSSLLNSPSPSSAGGETKATRSGHNPRAVFLCGRLIEKGVVTHLTNFLKEGPTRDTIVSSGVKWILHKLKLMDERCASLIPHYEAKDGRFKTAKAAAMQEAARQRALEAVRRNAALFTATAADQMLDDNDCESDSSFPASQASALSLKASQVAPECIVCRESTDAALGYVAFLQRSSILGSQRRARGMHVQSCGHALHRKCYDEYFSSVCQQSEMPTYFAIDVNRREYQCPLCKRLANTLLPRVVFQGSAPAVDEGSGSPSDCQGQFPVAIVRSALATIIQSSGAASGERKAWPEIQIFLGHLKESAGSVAGQSIQDKESLVPDGAFQDFLRIAGLLAFTAGAYDLEQHDLEAFGYSAVKGISTAEEASRMSHLYRLACAVRETAAEHSCGVQSEISLRLLMEAVSGAGGSCIRLLEQNALQMLAVYLSVLPVSAHHHAAVMMTRAKIIQLLLASWVEDGRAMDAQMTLEALLGIIQGDEATWMRTGLLSFLRCCSILLHLFSGDEGPLPLQNGSWEILSAQFSLPSLQDRACWTAPEDADFHSRWVSVLCELPCVISAELGRSFVHDYPARGPISMPALPHAYTELHTSLSENAAMEHPAICLICGSVLKADGSGECTNHAATCGQGVGLLFLQHECNALLIHGARAAYFPSPYVDSYGERHRNFRGRPLFLDQRRLALLRSIYLKHSIPQEVVQIRSQSRAVIRNNFY